MRKSIKIKLILAIILMIFIAIIGNTVSHAAYTGKEDGLYHVWDGNKWNWDVAALTTWDPNASGGFRYHPSQAKLPNPNPYYDLSYLLGQNGFNDAMSAMNATGQAWVADSTVWGYGNDDLGLTINFTNVSCIDPTNNKLNGKMKDHKIFGVLNINLSDDGTVGRTPNSGTLYYRNYDIDAKVQKKENLKLSQYNMGKWAYENYMAVTNAQPITSWTIAEYWWQYFTAAGKEYTSELKGYMTPLSLYSGKSSQSGSIPMVYYDAVAYGNFAKEISNAGNTTLVGGTTKSKTPNAGSTAKAGPYSFSKYIVDSYTYNAGGPGGDKYKSRYQNADKDTPGTYQQIKVQAILSNGRTIDNPIIKVNDQVVTDLKTGLKAGVSFTVEVPNAGTATISKVIFTSSYYVYGGRIYFVGGQNGGHQCRNVVTGTRKLVEDKVEFTNEDGPTPDAPDTPDTSVTVLAIEKVDENNNRLANAELTITVDNAYSTGRVRTARDKYILVGMDELLANDTTFVNYLSNSTINNAAKLFKTPCDNEVDDIREFIQEQLQSKVWNAVNNSTNWKNWQSNRRNNHVYNGVDYSQPIYGWVSHRYTPVFSESTNTWQCPYSDDCKQTVPHQHLVLDVIGYQTYDREWDCSRCIAEDAIAKYTPMIDEFIENYPQSTEDLVDWLENGGFNITSEDSSLSGIFSSGGSDWIDFEYSIYDIYSDRRYTDLAITKKDIMRVLTADIKVEVTENSAPTGYIAWNNGSTKTINIKYEDGKIVNGIERFSNGYYGNDFTNDKGAYLTDRNDEVEIEHRAIKESPSDGTYEVAKITAYDQTNEAEIRLGKLGDYGNYTLPVNATFQVKVTARETYWNGTVNEKVKTFTKTTQNGYLNITAQEFRDIGIDVIRRWTGTLKIEVTETVPPTGFIPVPGTMGIIVQYNKGRQTITTTATGAWISCQLSGNLIDMEVINPTQESSNLMIKKVGEDGTALSGAKFKATFDADWYQLDWNEATERWENNHYTGSTSITRTTGTLGEIILNSNELNSIGIFNFGRWTGTLKVTLEELTAPVGYKLISKQTIVLTYTNGSVTNSTYDSNYINVKNEEVVFNGGSSKNIPVIIAKDSLDSKLQIRKVDDFGNFLTGAQFSGTITASGVSGSQSYSNVSVDSKGYIDLTSRVNALVGNFGKYSGNIKVTIRETKAPSNYIGLSGTVTVTLTYSNGKLINSTSNNTKVNVGKADNGRDVTIAVRNYQQNDQRILEPIYISKIDSQSMIGIPNVGFNVTISTKENLDIGSNTLVLNNLRTNQDGLITISTDNLYSIGVTKGYTGNVYMEIEEFEANSEYEKLTEKIHLVVAFRNGAVYNITNTGTQAEKATFTNHCITSNGDNVIVIKNTLKPIDLVIQKSNFANGEVFNVDATFNVDVYTPYSEAKGHKLTKSLITTNSNGQIVFTESELRTLEGGTTAGKFFDGTYTGELKVTIEENSAESGAAMIPSIFTITLNLKNGRYVDGDDFNSAHASIKTNKNTVTLYVADAMSGTRLFIRGMVWEELATTKAAGTLVDGLYTTSSESENFDKLFDGIEVTLYKVENNALKFVEVSSGTNPTFTVDGKYEFQISNYVAGQDNYVVTFTFNGMEYTASPISANNALANWELSSKASEMKGTSSTILTRTYVNNLMKEIGSYPANYKIENFIFSNASDKFAHEGNTYYNIAYRYEEIADLQKEVSRTIQEYLLNQSGSSRSNNLDISTSNGLTKLIELYNDVADKYKNSDSEIYNKLQFIYDTRVSAVAGYYTQDGGIDNPANMGKYPHSSKKTTDINGHTVQEGINLGLYKRDRTELHLEKDIKETVVSMNGYDATYSMEELLSSYKQYLYQEDFNYETGENSNGIAWYDNNQIELYIKYKLTVYNTTNTPTKLTEIVDYFDSRFEYADSYKTSQGNTLAGLEVYKVDGNGNKNPFTSVTTNPAKDSKYIPASRIGLNGTNNTYASLYVTFNDGNEPELNAGEKLEVYITIRLGNGGNSNDPNTKVGSLYQNGSKIAKDVLNDFLNEDGSGSIVANGYAEINGYKAYKKDVNGNVKETGFIDAVSKPGNMKVKEYEDARNEYEEAAKNRTSNRDRFTAAQANLKKIQENDAWGVKLNISTNLENNNPYHRSITGNVWKASNQYTENLLKYAGTNGLGGIIVELVEIEPDGNQVVRARTVTRSDGSYTFTGYIPGDYTVRFAYGETFDNETIDGEGFTATQKQAINDTSKDASVNGQYYQSVKANENTNNNKYWYAQDTGNRYSDAYDEVTSRLEQIDAQTAGEATGDIQKGDKTVADKSWSWNYEVNGIESVEGKTHVDKIEAYTSTLNLEVEYTNNKPTGNRDYANYRYPIVSVDFGLTPRAEAEMNINKRVSNIKLYMQDGTKQLDADIKEDGTVEYKNADLYKNTVIPTDAENNNSYRDGLLEVLFDTQLLNGTTLEITYTITAKNDGQANTIRYFYNSGDSRNPIAIAYYGESLDKIVYYEDGNVRTHATDAGTWALKACDGGQKDVEVRTRATNIVDYIDPSLNFIQENKEGIKVNADWEITSASDFNSSRERTENADVMKKYNTIIRATGGKTNANYLDYLAQYNASTASNIESGSSVLYTPMKPGDKQTTTLTLSTVLGTSSTGTNDYEYSNLLEITKLENYAGKSTKLKAYDITGTVDRETSNVPSNTRHTPTVGTAKSPTIVIHEPTGLTVREESKSNLVIVLVALVILAVGIVLIKKFVLKPKTE